MLLFSALFRSSLFQPLPIHEAHEIEIMDTIVKGADYSFELISIETYAPQFIGDNKSFLGNVIRAFK